MRQKGGAFLILALLCSGFFNFLGSPLGGKNVRAIESIVVINEIAWMGTLVNANGEWLEIRNISSDEIDLSGWTLKATDGSPSISLAGTIAPAGYFLLERTSDASLPGVVADLIYSGSLSNTGETLELRDAGGNLIDQVDGSAGWSFGDNVTKQTMERKADSAWQNSAEAGGTPKAANSEPVPVTNTEATTTPTSTNENNPSATTGSAGGSIVSQVQPVAEMVKSVVFSEALPDPIGIDESAEFIEFYNPNKETVNLLGWKIESKVSSFEFKDKATSSVAGLSWYVLWRRDSKLIMANDEDLIKLYAPGKTTAIATLSYKDVETGESYSIDNSGKWYWTPRLTPGEKNSVNHLPAIALGALKEVKVGEPVYFDSTDSIDPDGEPLTFSWSFGDGATNNLATPEHTYFKPGLYNITLLGRDLDNEVLVTRKIKVVGEEGGVALTNNETRSNEIKNNKAASTIKKASKNSIATKKVVVKKITAAKASKEVLGNKMVKVAGVVTAVPGSLGTQIFYLAGEDDYQIYSYKKYFPKMAIGDMVEVVGEMVEGVVPRIKTKALGDIKVLGKAEAVEPVEMACDELNEESVGHLVKMEGELTKKSGATLYLDDSSAETAVYVKQSTGIDARYLVAGQKLSVTGIIEKTASGLRLVPRSMADLVLPEAAQADTYGEVSSTDWALPPRDKNKELLQYLLIVAGGVILIMGGWIYKKSR